MHDGIRLRAHAEAEALVGKFVCFRHLPASSNPTPIRVLAAAPNGMVLLAGWAGEFAPHLFVVVDGPKEEPKAAASPQKPWRERTIDLTCPRCGHVHEGVGECGMWLGAGRFCRCELEVPA